MSKRIQIDELPAETALARSGVLHTKSGGANKQTTVGDVLDLALDGGATGDTPTTTNVLLTKDLAGDNKTMTVQQVLNLVPPTQPSSTTMVAADDIVFADDNDSNNLKRTSIAGLQSLMSLLEIGSSTYAADGHVNIGAFQVRWGSGSSTVDVAESFVFEEAFTTSCTAVILQVSTPNAKLGLSVSGAPTNTQFVVNRSSDLDDTYDFLYIAVGY